MLSKTHQPTRKYHHHSTYYSKTQANFFKAYAQQIQFVSKFNDLLTSVDKRKVIKLTQDVKLGNKSFKKYLHQKKITYLKTQDIVALQDMLEKNVNHLAQNVHQPSGHDNSDSKKMIFPSVVRSIKSKDTKHSTIVMKSFSTLRKPQPEVYSILQKEMIKKGFMSLLQRLETLKKDEFINQAGYLQGVLVRQSQKLKDYWIEDSDLSKQLKKGRMINAKKMNLCEEIDVEEKLHGLYPLIMKNIREQTFAIQSAENTFSLLMQT